MCYSAIDLAKYFVTYYNKKQKPISNLKLQKLLYFAWIEFFKKCKNELFHDSIYAWKFGPVVPDVYYEFCAYAGMPITQTFEVVIDNVKDREIIDDFLLENIDKTAKELVDKSHNDDGAWAAIYKDGEGFMHQIPFDLIIDMECKEN